MDTEPGGAGGAGGAGEAGGAGRAGRAGWRAFAGGELEGQAPRRLCAACRARSHATAVGATLCFECHRAERERERAIRAAANLDTASEARFQHALPFGPVDQARLARLRAERVSAQAAAQQGNGGYDHRRHQAQIAARHALQRVVTTVRARGAARPEEHRVLAMALHAAELQLPAAWLPFVVAR